MKLKSLSLSLPLTDWLLEEDEKSKIHLMIAGGNFESHESHSREQIKPHSFCLPLHYIYHFSVKR